MTRTETHQALAISVAVAALSASGAFYLLSRWERPKVRAVERGGESTFREGRPSQASVPPNDEALVEEEGGTSLLKTLAKHLAVNDLARFQELCGPALREDDAHALREALQSGPWKLDLEQPVSELGKENGREQWAIHLREERSQQKARLAITLARAEDKAWRVSAVALPDLLPRQTLGLDAVRSADRFFALLQKQDFAQAKEMVEPEGVSDERLAALSILMDEGKFRLIDERPLVATNVNDSHAWIIVRVTSDLLKARSEFGLELNRGGGDWHLSQIHLSRLLNEFLKASKVDEVEGLPVVEHPKGGESIALYFNLNEEQPSTRSLRQLGIVAALVKTRKDSKLRISGHADALGEDNYNERLSARRAQRVKEALIALGLPGERIETKAFGEQQPLSPNTLPDGSDNPQGRKQNRRSEIYLDF